MDERNDKLRYVTKLCLLSVLILFIVYNLKTSLYFVTTVFRDPCLKYILLWTDPNIEPFKYFSTGQDTFLKYHCPVTNCYITSDKEFMNSLTDFHAIIFHGPDLNRSDINLPDIRLPYQKYVFASMESSAYYSIFDEKYDNFFNWTWTYKLNSDLYFGYIIIKNKDGEVIGPKEVMHWIKVEEMKPINATFKQELTHKKRLAAWFVSNCRALSKREKYVKAMRRELARYNKSNLDVDIFGACKKNKCPVDKKGRCTLLINKAYYFYLSFENSICDDYVTEKLLTALQNNAVPVVLGGANYSRFMPNGAYLNARKFSAQVLVQQMVDIVNNITKYHDFFRWKNYYSYHDIWQSPETNYFCRFCSKINEESPIRKLSYYKTFRKWWNSPILKN